MKNAEMRAVELIRDKRPQLDKLIQTLESHETLDRDQVKACLDENADR